MSIKKDRVYDYPLLRGVSAVGGRGVLRDKIQSSKRKIQKTEFIDQKNRATAVGGRGVLQDKIQSSKGKIQKTEGKGLQQKGTAVGERRTQPSRERRSIRKGSPFIRILYSLFCLLPLFILPFSVAAQPTGRRVGTQPTFKKKIFEEIAKDNRRNFHFVAAKLWAGHDTALAWKQLDSLLSEPTGDMFWTYPATAFYFYCKDILSDSWKAKFRHVWKTWTPYRGDTENHFLMYYETLYLMSQEWPGLPGSEWFNGKSSDENFRESEEYLNHWIDETVRYGQTEWDSPRYFYFYILPLLTLYDFADDAAMKQRCGMMIEYLLADYAAEYLNGNYCGAHSRDGDGSVINPRSAEARSYSDFYWEDSLVSILPDLPFAAMSSFQCPAIIREIAHDRDTAFVHYERKRSRAKMRFSNQKYTPVYKTTYMTRDYALGSMQGGLQQPIQQHTWDITFGVDTPNNTLFSLHPNASAEELGTFFPEEPEWMEKNILSSKASYGNENKWIGGSPCEQIVQEGSSLFARYVLPDSVRFGHVDCYFPKSLDMLIKNSNGWILGFVGNVVVGLRVSGTDSIIWSEEKDNRRLRLMGDTINITVGTALRSATPKSGDITGALAATAKSDSLRHDAERFRDYLFYGPHLQSKYESGILTMTCHGKKRILDFIKNEVREE